MQIAFFPITHEDDDCEKILDFPEFYHSESWSFLKCVNIKQANQNVFFSLNELTRNHVI